MDHDPLNIESFDGLLAVKVRNAWFSASSATRFVGEEMPPAFTLHSTDAIFQTGKNTARSWFDQVISAVKIYLRDH